jgi:hypothetical protein
MLNPVGLVTYYFFRVIGVGDVPKKWFVDRKLSRCIVQGPGVFAFEGDGNNTSFTDVTFKNCDFIVVPNGSYTNMAFPIDGLKASHVSFDRCAFLVPDEFYQHLKRNVTVGSEMPNRIEGLMPAEI